jgi:hypothetical protein
MNDVLLDKPFYGNLHGTLAQPSAVVEDLAILLLNAVAYLIEGDIVTLFLEAERPSDDVQEHFQLSARKQQQELVKEFVRNWREVWALEALECVGSMIELNFWHRKTS